MENTKYVKGIIDEGGKVFLPEEVLDKMQLDFYDSVELFVHQDHLLMRKIKKSCVFCKNSQGTVSYKGKYICRHCLLEMEEQRTRPS